MNTLGQPHDGTIIEYIEWKIINANCTNCNWVKYFFHQRNGFRLLNVDKA